MKHTNLTIQEVLRYGSLGEVEGISPEIASRILEEYPILEDTGQGTSREDELYSAVVEAVTILESVL